MLTHKNLDKRICDCEDCENTQTYREYIRETESCFNLLPLDIDNATDEQLNNYINLLDELWTK